MRLRRTFWSVLLLLIAGIIVSYFTPLVSGTKTPVFFTRLVYLIGFLLVAGWAWAALAVRGFLLTREARVLRHQVGQIFEERFRLQNRLPFPRLWVEVRDKSELPGNSGSRVLSLIGANQSRTYIAYTLLTRRGAFHLGPTDLAAGDPFGMFTYKIRYTSDSTLIVLPYWVGLVKFPAPVGVFPGGRAIQRKANEITAQAAGVREYAPGDSLRRIHWPSSVRRDRLMSKEFEQDPQADVWIFLDAFAPVHVREEETAVVTAKPGQIWIWQRKMEVKLPPDTFEYAVGAAASIANFYIREGRTVGFVGSSEVVAVLTAERGERQLNKILENLTFLKSNGSLPLTAMVESQSPNLPRASTVVLITPAASETVDLAVDFLVMRNLRPVVVVLNAASFGGAQDGLATVERMRQRGIPSVRVSKDDDLKDALETQA